VANFTPFEEELIISATEDVAWLPEAMLVFRNMNPNFESDASVVALAGIVRSLIDRDYVELCREKWSTPPRDRLMQPIDRVGIDAALANQRAWVWDDSTDEYLTLVSTQQGKEAFAELISRPR
jgi:hypothetical protein